MDAGEVKETAVSAGGSPTSASRFFFFFNRGFVGVGSTGQMCMDENDVSVPYSCSDLDKIKK